MANVLKSYKGFEIPFPALGTAAEFEVSVKRNPYVEFLTAYVPCDGSQLAFRPSPEAVSDYVYSVSQGSTGGTGPLSTISGYGLLDISQSNDYLDLVGSLTRGTGTGSDFSTAVTYVEGLLTRLKTDYPDVKWSVKGVPFNHYFMIPAPSTTADESPFGTGDYFHPNHATGDVDRVYDWTNAPSSLSQFYRDRSTHALNNLTSLDWVCPSGLLFFDNTLPFLRSTFDPETMYQANLNCFRTAKDFVASSGKQLKVIPVCSPFHHVVGISQVYDPSGGVGTGSSAKATPTQVVDHAMMYQFYQPIKDLGCDGFMMWNNAHSLCYLAGTASGDITTLARNFFANRLYSGFTGVEWESSLVKEEMILSVTDALVGMQESFANTVQFKTGVSCCPTGPDQTCADCKCLELGDGDPRPLCSSDPVFGGCCDLAAECEGVVCGGCDCNGDGCQYDPTSPGDANCPPQFVSVSACRDAICSLCCGFGADALKCACCCAEQGSAAAFRDLYQGTFAHDSKVNWRDRYKLPYGGAFGSNQVSITKDTYFLIPSVVQAIDPLALTGQANYISTTGSIE